MQIYVTHNGQQLGPYDEDAVRNRLRDGSLAPTDLAWSGGPEGWIPLYTMPELVATQPVPRPTPTPIPKTARNRGSLLYKLVYVCLVGLAVFVIQLFPSVESVNKRGIAHAKKGESDEAIADYTEAIRKWGGKAYLYYNRGLSYKKKGEYDQAIADFTEAIRLDPKDPDAYSSRGDAYYQKKDYARALPDFNQAILLKPSQGSYYYNRALLYKYTNDNDRALADFTESLRRDPKDTSALVERGIIYYRQEDYDRAIADYTEAIRLNPAGAAAYFDRALIYEEKHDYEKAIADFRQAMEHNPKDPDACQHLAWLLASSPQAHLRDGSKAVLYATKACELSEWKTSSLAALAAAYAETGNFEEAIKWETTYIWLLTTSDGDKTNARARLALYEKRKPYRRDR